MYNVRPTSKFQKDLKRAKRRGYDIDLLRDIIKKLAAGSRCQRRTEITTLRGLCWLPGVPYHPGLAADLRSGRGRSDFVSDPGQVRTVTCFRGP